MQKLTRFARYWDLVANSGRFAHTLPLILSDAPFAAFMALSEWLYEKTDATHRIALDRLAGLVAEWLVSRGHEKEAIDAALERDHAGKHRIRHVDEKQKKTSLPQRQATHLSAA
jgi:hypothetical protein